MLSLSVIIDVVCAQFVTKVLLVPLLCSKGASKPGLIAQLVKGLPCKHENLSLVPRTHIKIHKTPENKNKRKIPTTITIITSKT